MERYFQMIHQEFFPNLNPLFQLALYVLIVLLTAAIAWWLFNLVIGKIEKTYQDRPLLENNRQIFLLIKRAGHYSIIILTGIVLLHLFQVAVVGKVFYACMVLILSSIASSIINILLPYVERNIAKKTRTNVDDVIIDLSKKFAGIIIYTTGIILALDLLELNIMPFVAGAGVAGIAIGFAAKDTLSNLIAGILLIVDRPFEVGDRIEVWQAPANSSTWGDVIDIGLRATKIRTTDHIVIVIPNNQIMTRDIINYTAVSDEIRVRVPIGIAYEADVAKAKAAIIDVCLELDWVMRDPPPKVVVRHFGESGINLQARAWISDPRRRMDTISHITDRVKEVFQEEGIEIPYPKRDIYIRKEEP